MWTTEAAAPLVLRRLDDLEQQLDQLAARVNALEHHTLGRYALELDALKKEVGKLKVEIEEMRPE